MTFISLLKELWKRKILVALAIVIAAAAAVGAYKQVSKDSTPEAQGTTEVLIDSARSPIAGSKRNVEALATRAAVFARLMASGDIVKEIAKEAGVQPWEIQVKGPMPFPGEVPGVSEGAETLPYGLTFTQVGELPIVTITSRAPTVPEARALAAAAPRSLNKTVKRTQKQQDTPATEKVEIRVLGPAIVSSVSGESGKKIAVAAFFGVLLLELALILGLPRLVSAWKRDDEEVDPFEDVADISDPTPTLVIPNGSGTGVRKERSGAGRRRR